MKYSNLSGEQLLIPFSHLLNRIYGYTHKTRKNRFVIHIIGKIRRFCLIHFKKAYIRDHERLRGGQCRQCAWCCSLAFRCPLLTRENLCLTYIKGRPDACKLFPIDQKDIDDVAVFGVQCGYWFEEGEYKNAVSVVQGETSMHTKTTFVKRWIPSNCYFSFIPLS